MKGCEVKSLPRSTHPPTTLITDPCHRGHATLPGYVPYDTHPEYITLPVRCFAGHARTFTAAQTPLSLHHFASLRRSTPHHFPPIHCSTNDGCRPCPVARPRACTLTLHTVALLPDTHGSCPVTPHTSPAPHACLICPLGHLYLPPSYQTPPDASPAAACMITAESATATIAAIAAAAAAAAYLGHAVFLPPPPTHQPPRTCVVAPNPLHARNPAAATTPRHCTRTTPAAAPARCSRSQPTYNVLAYPPSSHPVTQSHATTAPAATLAATLAKGQARCTDIALYARSNIHSNRIGGRHSRNRLRIHSRCRSSRLRRHRSERGKASCTLCRSL